MVLPSRIGLGRNRHSSSSHTELASVMLSKANYSVDANPNRRRPGHGDAVTHQLPLA